MSDKNSKMSAMSELQPYFDSYLEKMRKAKNSSGLTLQELSDLSGVPYNNICDTNSGRTKQPLLFYEAAKCKALGLSLNAMCGLDEPNRAVLHSNNAPMSWNLITSVLPPLMSRKINGSKPPVLLSALSQLYRCSCS